MSADSMQAPGCAGEIRCCSGKMPTQGQPPIARAIAKSRMKPPRGAWEKALARQRSQQARRQIQEVYDRLPNRPIWQAMRDSRPHREVFYSAGCEARGLNRRPLASRSHPPVSKAEVSTLQRSGTFYFALTDVEIEDRLHVFRRFGVESSNSRPLELSNSFDYFPLQQ
jgi:hypothetical protein